jgi:Putative transposase
LVRSNSNSNEVLTDDGQVVMQLRHRWTDGTTHLVFDPVEFLGRLAVLIPRPRINLILYHGVLAPRAAWRRQVVRHAAAVTTGETAATDVPPRSAGAPDEASPPRAGGRLWADLMRRSFGFDVLACPRCGGRLRLVALIEEAAVIARILGHLGLSAEIPGPCVARAPPLPMDGGAAPMDDASTVFDPCS